ncbi:MAG: alpha-amylase family glycosyl hydrolase [Myxococcota bacterium]|nr:alpha-amylase family glycosyl hydrolase [Myxococcota bacterium]
MTAPILIYNLFPRLVGPLDRWLPHAHRAAELGFSWLFVNPVQPPGLSGSIYSIKDHLRVDPDLLPPGTTGDGRPELQQVLGQIHDLGLKVMVDLVVNHTAIDSPLIASHPAWFSWSEENGTATVRHPFVDEAGNPPRRVIWGDLAEVNNETSDDLEGLWSYWEEVVTEGVRLGFDGFRCDAAYKVPARLWRRLTTRARSLLPEAMFAAETLGCGIREILALQGCGFDLLFNSSKWWNFDQPWALEQHELFQSVAPSISFPESHDTERLAETTGGLLAVQQQRYAFAAAFSKSLMIPIGYEFGARRRLDVVTTRPESWEEPALDLQAFIRRVNELKGEHPLLQREGEIFALTPFDRPTLVLGRRDPAWREGMLILINKDWRQPQPVQLPSSLAERIGTHPKRLRLHRLFAGSEEEWPAEEWLMLEPAEVVYALGPPPPVTPAPSSLP